MYFTFYAERVVQLIFFGGFAGQYGRLELNAS